ncbi:response regulator [bacterium]|nr:response regulator [bacterium]
MKTILVIEDDLLIQELLVTLLEDEGYRVLAAEDGLQGVSLALEHHPDLVLSDLNLPHLDGFEVARQLSQAGMRVVAVTAHTRSQEMGRIQSSGFCGHLAKPVNPVTFARELRAWL